MLHKYTEFVIERVKIYEPLLSIVDKDVMVNAIVKMTIKQGGFYVDDKLVKDEEEIIKDLETSNMNDLTHEYIHSLQEEKYPEMFGLILKQTSEDWDKLEKDGTITKNMKAYLSNPPEIMCYAFSYVYKKKKNVGEKIYGEINKSYEKIGGEIYVLFLKYVDFYEKNIK